ncbi:hypothetical protein SEPCBS57363_006071 [Sporothrix epigloea]|uniref:Uncharacterized protein n=1 Tax=Sporothrix epigloea TaxID=1892477 RepID=A0ABP0E577_9PEZI
MLADRVKTHPPVIETPESRQLARSLYILQSMVANKMEALWEHSLAGKWVLHVERELYIPAYDTHFRERDADDDDDDDDGAAGYVVIDRQLDLRFDSRFQPVPHDKLRTVAYWEWKKADLSKMYEDVEAGRLTRHHFSEGDRIRITLLERGIKEELERRDRGGGNVGNQRMDNIAAWLNQGTERPEQSQTHMPTPPRAASKGKCTAADDTGENHALPLPAKRTKGRQGTTKSRTSTK